MLKILNGVPAIIIFITEQGMPVLRKPIDVAQQLQNKFTPLMNTAIKNILIPYVKHNGKQEIIMPLS